MTTITPAEANQLERTTPLRIKLAALDIRGAVIPDSHEEYQDFLADLPPGWEVNGIGMIETRTESQRRAWHLSHQQSSLVAVEHETGLELLLDPAIIAAATPAIIDFCKWATDRWKGRRQGTDYKSPTSMVIEVLYNAVDGNHSSQTIKLTFPLPASEEELSRYVRVAQQLSGT
jgi:hypothetical protein